MTRQAALVALAAFALSAQGHAAEPDARARQAALFEAMVASPADLELMFAYAEASMRVADYEAAISTLERMLVFDPGLTRVKLELGVAYFRLGSYEIARSYFEDVLATDPPETVAARVAPFLDEIETRTARVRISGFASAGPIFATNANLGPDDSLVLVAGFPGGVGRLDESATAKQDVGVRLSGAVTHEYDLRRPNADAWVSTAFYTGQRFEDQSQGDFDALDVTTGPRLALDERAFGPKLRPYAQAGAVRVEDGLLYAHAGLGFDYADTLDPALTAFAHLSLQQRRHREEEDEDLDGGYGFAQFGLERRVGEAGMVRGSLLLETDRTEADYASNVEIGLRLYAAQEFAVGIMADGVARPWTASLLLQGSGRAFEDPDPEIDPERTRRDFDARAALRLSAPLAANWDLAGEVSYFERLSNIRNYDADSLEVGLSVVLNF